MRSRALFCAAARWFFPHQPRPTNATLIMQVGRRKAEGGTGRAPSRFSIPPSSFLLLPLLLRFDAYLPHDLRHPLEFRALDLEESVGRAGGGVRALLLVAVLHVVGLQELHGVGVDLRDQVFRERG